MSDDDFKFPFTPQDEWTWIDDIAYAGKMIAVIAAVVAAFGFIIWRVL